MVDPRVLNGRAIKIIKIIHVELLLLFASIGAEVEFFREIKMIFI